MTFKEKMVELLHGQGMFQSQAEAVVELVIADPANEAMKGRWNEDIAGYPPEIVAVLWLSTKHTAREWIAENCPRAWFRPLFDDGATEDAKGEAA